MSALTPDDIENQVFREKFKGYDQDEVDAFLDRVSDRLNDLLKEREELLARVARVERDAAESIEAERLLKRTLITAQRTADETVAEAAAQANTTVAEAAERATQITTEAEERAHRTVVGAEDQARQIVAEAEQRAADLVSSARREAQARQDAAERDLEQVRRAVAELQRFRTDYRDRVRAVVAEQLEILDRSGDIPEVPAEMMRLAGEAERRAELTGRTPADAARSALASEPAGVVRDAPEG